MLLDQPGAALGIHAGTVSEPDPGAWYSGDVATFTALGTEELAAIVDEFGLGPLTGFHAIAAGTINSNFSVVSAAGRTFVRVNEGKSEDDVAWEARLVASLAAAGVATPAPHLARDGRPYAAVPGHPGKWASVFPWCDGRHLSPAEITPRLAEALGRQLATLHVAGLALPSTWRRRSIYDHDHLVRRYAGFRADPDPELATAIAILGEELAACEAARDRRAAATTGIIHGDLFRDNVLWEGDRITAILDFEQASGGSLAYDLAVCINDWCWRRGPELATVRALLAGYAGVRRLPATDRAALPIEVRAAAARFTITRITDVYLPKLDNPDKDFRAFLARVVAWRGPAGDDLCALIEGLR